MNHNYADIRDKIKEEPQWFDEQAVPRYCKFAPNQLSDIYSDECALVLIACQACQTEFKVAFSRCKLDDIRFKMMYPNVEPPTIAKKIKDKSIHYGDPPNIDCCPAGATMNCDDLKVLEYWVRDGFEWVRKPELEVVLSPVEGEG